MKCTHCYFCGRDRDEIEGILIEAYLDSEIGICGDCVRQCQRIADTAYVDKIVAKVKESVFSEIWGTD